MMNNFIEFVPTDKIRGAAYNPRRISEQALNMLVESIRTFGMIKPLIVNNQDMTIVAGHQRKKAADILGLKDVPCIFISSPSKEDEITFNLVHNSIETSVSNIFVEGAQLRKYTYCQNSQIECDQALSLITIKEINKLLSQYGEWGSVVVDESGKVILNAEYAYCAKNVGYGVLAYAIPNDMIEQFARYLDADYGKYYFDALGIKTYHQYRAQPKRLSENATHKNFSELYEKFIIPLIQEEPKSIVDIGAGRMKYVKMLRAKGIDIHGYEPALIKLGKSRIIDIEGIVISIKQLFEHMKNDGLFDICVLEAVINSVVDNEFEKAVLLTCNNLLKQGGSLFTCTRNIKNVSPQLQRKSSKCGVVSELYWLDEDGYSVRVAGGIAYKQKFHSVESFMELLKKYFHSVNLLRETHAYIYCEASMPKRFDDAECREYLEKEFNIEYPGEYRHNQHTELLDAIMERIRDRNA